MFAIVRTDVDGRDSIVGGVVPATGFEPVAP
jgi:hypothetical protein